MRTTGALVLAVAACGDNVPSVPIDVAMEPRLIDQFLAIGSWIEDVQYNNQHVYSYLPCAPNADCRTVVRSEARANGDGSIAYTFHFYYDVPNPTYVTSINMKPGTEFCHLEATARMEGVAGFAPSERFQLATVFEREDSNLSEADAATVGVQPGNGCGLDLVGKTYTFAYAAVAHANGEPTMLAYWYAQCSTCGPSNVRPPDVTPIPNWFFSPTNPGPDLPLTPCPPTAYAPGKDYCLPDCVFSAVASDPATPVCNQPIP